MLPLLFRIFQRYYICFQTATCVLVCFFSPKHLHYPNPQIYVKTFALPKPRDICQNRCITQTQRYMSKQMHYLNPQIYVKTDALSEPTNNNVMSLIIRCPVSKTSRVMFSVRHLWERSDALTEHIQESTYRALMDIIPKPRNNNHKHAHLTAV